jgi:hypothetical protein
MENKFRYVYQHEETGRIVAKIYSLEEIEYKDLYLARHNIIARNLFTQLCDKNNKEIYHKDILMNSFCGDIWVVDFKDGEFIVGLVPSSGIIKHPENAKYPHHIESLFSINDTFEKIGNVYENSDLLNSYDD